MSRQRLRLGPLRLGLLFCGALLSGCSWMFVPKNPEKYEAQGMPCESSYSWPIADSAMAGLVVPGTAAGTIYGLQRACQQGVDCQTSNIVSVITGVVGVIAIFFYIGSHHDGMRRVTQCRRANIRYRFSQQPRRPPPAATPPAGPRPGEVAPAPAPAGAAPVDPAAPAPPAGTGAPGTVGATVPVTPLPDPGAPVEALEPDAAAPADATAPYPPAPPPGPASAEGLPPPPVMPPSSASQAPREVSFHDSALDELSRLEADARRRLRAAARSLSTHPYPLSTVTLKAPYEGSHGLPVGGTGRVLVYRVSDAQVVIEAILPGAAFGIPDPGAGDADAPTPPPAAPPPDPSPPPGGDGFVPPP